jgi:ubiquinone/menaquinone biosynthesis C-methylase UbiE
MSKQKPSKNQDSHQLAAQAYAKSFEGEDRLAKHIRKFSTRIDSIRDQIELEVIGKYANGELFDCSLGFGRFVGRLPNVTRYEGMDISNTNVNYVKKKYPQIQANQRNLLDGIKQPDQKFDTVICIRTLPVLPNIPYIIQEMTRIAKPGGLIIITYGLKSEESAIGGHSYQSCSYNLESIFSGINLEIADRTYKDALLSRVKQKSFFKRLFNSRVNLIPDWLYAKIDVAISKLGGAKDYVLILQKVD